MKGPSHSRQIDVRRIWECPVCQKRIKTAGSVVNLRCEACARNKTGDTAWMRLIEPARRFPKPTRPESVPEEQEGHQTSEPA